MTERTEQELRTAYGENFYNFEKETRALRDFLRLDEHPAPSGDLGPPRRLTLREHLLDTLAAMLRCDEVLVALAKRRIGRRPPPDEEELKLRAADRGTLDVQSLLSRWREAWPDVPEFDPLRGMR